MKRGGIDESHNGTNERETTASEREREVYSRRVCVLLCRNAALSVTTSIQGSNPCRPFSLACDLYADRRSTKVCAARTPCWSSCVVVIVLRGKSSRIKLPGYPGYWYATPTVTVEFPISAR
eukprot:821921-Rhodomonas_salina.1